MNERINEQIVEEACVAPRVLSFVGTYFQLIYVITEKDKILISMEFMF